MQPRIYIYKITFEEVPYYYYGVHKERKYDEYYMGSPYTHKWCWELYTPKKQILEFFEYSDECWIEAQEVEKRLIKPFYNTDKWCLNESCGGKISLTSNRKAGQKTYELGLGCYSRTKKEMQEQGRKNGIKTYELGLGFHSRTKEEMTEHGKIGGNICKENKLGIFALTKEQRSENSKKTASKSKKLGIGMFSWTKEQRSEYAKIGNSQKWQCTETGFISTAGPLTLYQNKRGIDKSKRKKI
jgi:hypothetical protein